MKPRALLFFSLLFFLAGLAVHLLVFPGRVDRATATGTTTPRRASASIKRPVRIGIFGDIRPECKTGRYNEAEISAVLHGLAAAGPDLIIATGDYICAWPDEPAKAQAQLSVVRGLAVGALGLDLFRRVRWAHGNHERGHAQAVANTLGDWPTWAVDLYGVRIVAAESDKTWQAGDKSRVAWLHDQLLPPAGLTVFVRHEPWGSHGTRNDAEMRGVVDRAGVDLQFFGHEHVYRRNGRLITAGNGGAPGRDGFLGFVILDVAVTGAATLTAYEVDATGQGPAVARDVATFERG